MNLIFAVVFISFSGLCGAKTVDQCPVFPLKPPIQCSGLSSECWSPGERDVDCPDDGLCCFDGCVNVCFGQHQPPVDPETPHPCTTEYVTQTEEVPEEVCSETPAMEVCTNVTTSECEQDCHFEDAPETVTEVTTCCEKRKELVCHEVPCDPEGGTVEVVPLVETVCKKRERVCHNVPEEVCHDDEVEECNDVKTKQCHTIRKPTEWPTTIQECGVKHVPECRILHREICNDYIGHLSPKLHHLLFKKKKHYRNPMCYTAPRRICNKRPFTVCRNVTKVTVEYEDVEECQPSTESVCSTNTVTKCEYVDREQCNEAEDICKTTNSTKTIFVKNNCLFVGTKCHFEDYNECTDHDKAVEKILRKKVCENICRPVLKNECHKGEPSKDCRTIFKTMNYKVPVLKC